MTVNPSSLFDGNLHFILFLIVKRTVRHLHCCRLYNAVGYCFLKILFKNAFEIILKNKFSYSGEGTLKPVLKITMGCN